jgi:hypothetical protein
MSAKLIPRHLRERKSKTVLTQGYLSGQIDTDSHD